MDKKMEAKEGFCARMARSREEIEEMCRNPEGASNKEVVKAIAYFMLEANSDLEGSFREFDRMLEDKNSERVSRLKAEIAQVSKDLDAATNAVEILLTKCLGQI